MCPRQANCDEVVSSVYGKTFGVANTYLGVAYYTTVAILMAMVLVGISFPLEWALIAIFVFSAGIFSLYLIFVQAFVLRAWCLWCLFSAVINILLCGIIVHILFGL